MITLQVNDMTCGHCVGQITKSVKAVDPDAALEFDLASHQVQIASALANVELTEAIADAGYTPVLLSAATKVPAASTSRARSGCCCS
jgi:copper chaperone